MPKIVAIPLEPEAFNSPPFSFVTGMENDLLAIKHFAHAIDMMAQALGDPSASAFQELAWVIKEKAKLAEEKRAELFDLTHPNRAHFERHGWPGRAPERPRRLRS